MKRLEAAPGAATAAPATAEGRAAAAVNGERYRQEPPERKDVRCWGREGPRTRDASAAAAAAAAQQQQHQQRAEQRSYSIRAREGPTVRGNDLAAAEPAVVIRACTSSQVYAQLLLRSLLPSSLPPHFFLFSEESRAFSLIRHAYIQTDSHTGSKQSSSRSSSSSSCCCSCSAAPVAAAAYSMLRMTCSKHY
ncbi:hypothetical protein Esti_004262 [Eimeria stiedai]